MGTWTPTGECLVCSCASCHRAFHDWSCPCRQALLGEVDEMLVKEGSSVLSERERSVAIKRLVECTGSKGATFALRAARDTVMARRRMQLGR